MKQILFTLAFFTLLAPSAFSQQAPLQGFIDLHKHDKAFSFAFLSKDLFDVTIQNNVEDETWKKLQNVVRNIGSLTVLAADSIESGLALYKEALLAVPVDDFDELLAVQDGKDRVKIWVKEAGSVVTDLVLLVGTADQFVLICFAGNLELSNITALAGLFDAQKVASLANTSQGISADFSINPNPGSGAFTLSYPSMDDQPAQMSVLDQNGRQISAVNLSGERTQLITLQELPAGLYWIQLKTAHGKVGVKQLQIIK